MISSLCMIMITILEANLNFLTVFGILFLTPQSSGVEIKIDSGKIIGHTVKLQGIKVTEFLGIPYALPPVGEFRFKKPNAKSLYKNTIVANKQPPACPQFSIKPYPCYFKGPEISEDCLYLNIWTPASVNSSNKKDVMFWIHGGGFSCGSIRQDVYSGIPLAALGDIIVVTVNYRLGSFGFLYTGTEESPGNAGLWDMLLGLLWVNKHIEAFGGDKNRITLAGESAGAMAVGLLSASPLAKGLFKRMIMQSGSPLPFTVDGLRNLLLTQRLASMIGCVNETAVSCLRGVDFETLSRAEAFLVPREAFAFLPQFGDALIPENPKQTMMRGDFGCRELMIGVNHDEGTNLVSTLYPDIFGFFGEKKHHVTRTEAETIIRNIYSRSPYIADAAVQYYLPKILPDVNDIYKLQACTAVGDYGFVCPSTYYAQQCARHGKVYFYYWKHRPTSTRWAKWEGATHFSEVKFVFGQPLLHPEKYLPIEMELSKKMIRIWTDFVKFGSPTGFFWPLYSNKSQVVASLSADVPHIEPAPHIENCRFVAKIMGLV